MDKARLRRNRKAAIRDEIDRWQNTHLHIPGYMLNTRSKRQRFVGAGKPEGVASRMVLVMQYLVRLEMKRLCLNGSLIIVDKTMTEWAKEFGWTAPTLYKYLDYATQSGWIECVYGPDKRRTGAIILGEVYSAVWEMPGEDGRQSYRPKWLMGANNFG